MSNHNDTSLLGFLQKKSLFANSPSTNTRKRSRSRSKDSKNFDRKSNKNTFEDRQFEDTLGTPKQQLYQQNLKGPSYMNPENGKLFKTFQPLTQNSFDNSFHTFNPHGQVASHRNNHFEDKTSVQSFKGAQKNLDNHLWTGLMVSANSFQSARLESSQCLQNLNIKISSQIFSINYRIDAFNAKMAKILNNQFRVVREKIMHVFETAFKESEKFIQEYMKKKEQELAGQLIKMKDLLEKESLKIQSMSEQLKKPQWRKVAGQILSTQFENRVQQIVRKSQGLQVGHWQLSDIGGYRVKNIESEIRQIVRLKA